MSFDGKVAWVTGASSGIGEGLAHALAKRGASLVLSARREELLQKVRGQCREPQRHLVVPLDLADAASLEDAVGRVMDHFGHVDLLINNAGLSQRALAADTALDVDRRIMEVNYFGPITLTKQLLPDMIRRGTGHIVVISSLLGKFGVSTRTAYAASKHALHGFFDSLRAEVYQAGLDVTVICPGFVRTNVSYSALTGDGTPQGSMDEDLQSGLSPRECAEKVIRAVERRKREVYIGGKERWSVVLNRFAPGLFNRIIRKTKLK